MSKTRRTRGTSHRGMVVAAVALALGVGACQGGGSRSGSETPGQMKLTMYYPVAVGGPLTKVVDDLIAEFETSHKNIDVQAIYSGTYRDTMTKAQTAFRAGTPPDVAVLLSTELYSLTDAKMIVSYDELLKGEDKTWLNRFFPALMKNSKDGEGRTWGIPFQRSTIVQYWNKELFKKAGLDPQKAPATWDDLAMAAEKVKASKAAPYGVEIPTTDYGYWMLQALATQNGVEVFNQAGNQTSFDNPAVIEALSYWHGLAAKGVMPSGTIEWGAVPQDFLQGKTAMVWTTTGNLTNIKKTATFDFGVSPLPSKVRPGSPTGGGNLFVFKTKEEDKQKAATELVKWLSDPAQAAKWSIETGYIATSSAAYETDAMQKYATGFPQALVARDQLQVAVSELSTHDEGRVLELVNNEVAAAMTGQKTPEQALKSAQSQADSLLKRYR